MHRHIITGLILDYVEANCEHCQLSSLVFMQLYINYYTLSTPHVRNIPLDGLCHKWNARKMIYAVIAAITQKPARQITVVREHIPEATV